MFYDPRYEVQKHGAQLPHWQQRHSWIFVTWRLCDSVPQELLIDWKRRRDHWLRHHPQPWDEDTEKLFHQTFSGELERWLDQGHGSCLLRDPRAATIVAETLFHDQGNLYDIDHFVVMPNHVHLLLRLRETPIQSLMQTFKSVSSHRLNKDFGRTGKLWQKNYWDRIIRSEAHLRKTRDYIVRNPVKAKLKSDEFLLWPRPTDAHGEAP